MMPYQKPPQVCPVCKKAADFKFFQDHDSKWGSWSLYECSECTVQFWYPMKNPGRDWYEAEAESWRIHQIPKKKTKPSWQHKEFLKFFKNQNNKNRKLLDLGCGTGVFLNAAKKLGFDVWGVDFDREAIEHAKSLFNLKNVYTELIESFFQRKDLLKFDVITFFEVIEHLDNIPKFLDSLTEVAKNGAYIVLSTPNRRREDPSNPKINDLPPKHLTRWDYNSLSHVLDLHNINVEKYKYGNEIEYFISRHFRFNTVRKLQKKQQEENKRDSRILRMDQIVSFIYTIARIKDLFLMPIAWIVVNFKKILNLQKEGDCIFLIGRLWEKDE